MSKKHNNYIRSINSRQSAKFEHPSGEVISKVSLNGMPDHIHILFGLRPSPSIADLMQDAKGSSSKWINDKKLVQGKFSWQEGYGAFSYSKN